VALRADIWVAEWACTVTSSDRLYLQLCQLRLLSQASEKSALWAPHGPPWAQTRQTNGFLEALNGLFQATKRRARGYQRLSIIRTVVFLLAGKLDFQTLNHT
jgi:hypothetical protein